MPVVPVIQKKPEELNLKEDVPLHPGEQHIPRNEALKHLRPPPPVVPPEEQQTVFVGTSAFRDGWRCGTTLLTALARASDPKKIRIGVVDQVLDDDVRCLDAYCQQARAHWNKTGNDECPYRENIRVDERKAEESRGPVVARSYQQKLLGDEEFCFQVDCHSIFTNNWDKAMIQDWQDSENEMAVLTTYPHDLHNFVKPNGDNNAPSYMPHICGFRMGAHGLIRNKGATLVTPIQKPQLSAYYGAGLVFSKCHAERRVPIDPLALWVFDGEEFSRAAQLWVAGYDMYTPSSRGHAIYHNYSAVSNKYWSLPVDKKVRENEEIRGVHRVKLHIGMSFQGDVNTEQFSKYYETSRVRTLEQFYNFSGIHVNDRENWPNHTCSQYHWVPYSYPEDVEELLPGWKLYGGKVAEASYAPKITSSTSTASSTTTSAIPCPDRDMYGFVESKMPLTTSQGIQLIAFFGLALLFITRRRMRSTAREE